MSAGDRHPQLADPGGQYALEVALPQRQPVVVAGGEVADIQGDPGERLYLHRLPLREETIGDAALIEHLDGARMQTAGAGAVERVMGTPLANTEVDLRQG